MARVASPRKFCSSAASPWLVAVVFCFHLCGCGRTYRTDLDYDYNVVQSWQVEELTDGTFVQFESVFWEPDDTPSLRKMIAEDQICVQRSCLEIGTGTGLIAILCAKNDATRVVATDINPAAIANAKYNAAMLGVDETIEFRQVDSSDPSAFSVIKPAEKFDLIISNPPWEDGDIDRPLDHAYYDPDFQLMDSLLDGLPKHLKIDGRCLLAYGHRPAIERLLRAAAERGYITKVLDDRELSELPTDFLPGMVIEVKCPHSLTTPAKVP